MIWHEYCLVINTPTRFKSFVSPPYLHIMRKMSDLCPKQALPHPLKGPLAPLWVPPLMGILGLWGRGQGGPP